MLKNSIKQLGKDYTDGMKLVGAMTILPGMMVIGYSIEGLKEVVNVFERSIDLTKEQTEDILNQY